MIHCAARRIRTRTDKSGRGGTPSVLLVVGVILLAIGCARNPVTGRPNAVITTEEGEIRQGNEAALIVEKELGFVPDEALETFVSDLGERIARHSPRTKLSHDFHVVEMKEPNAFALPGGHIYVSRGLLALCNNEHELAVVIAHEIAHVAARHSVQRQAASVPLLPMRIAAGIGGALTSIVSPGLGKVVSGIGQLPGALALASYSRDQEREADRLGQQFAAAAGFDPSALATFMATLSREEELAGNDPERRSFLHSHPTSPERSIDAEAYAQELVVATDQPAVLSQAEFFDVLDGLPVGDNAAEGVFIDDRFLHPGLRLGLQLPADWKYINSRRALVAQQKDQLAYVVLEVADEGSDPMETALVFDKEARLDASPRRLKINGLDAVDAQTTVGGGGEAVRLQLTWIAHDGLIYRIMGAAAPRDFEALQPKFSAAAASFHALDERELHEINQDTLRIAKTRKKEDLEQLTQRTRNVWSLEHTAVANGLADGTSPAAGALVKIARAERYVPPPKPPEPDESDEKSQK